MKGFKIIAGLLHRPSFEPGGKDFIAFPTQGGSLGMFHWAWGNRINIKMVLAHKRLLEASKSLQDMVGNLSAGRCRGVD